MYDESDTQWKELLWDSSSNIRIALVGFALNMDLQIFYLQTRKSRAVFIQLVRKGMQNQRGFLLMGGWDQSLHMSLESLHMPAPLFTLLKALPPFVSFSFFQPSKSPPLLETHPHFY